MADLYVDGLPTIVVTHQLQVEHRTGKVRQSETDVLPLCRATNYRLLKKKEKKKYVLPDAKTVSRK